MAVPTSFFDTLAPEHIRSLPPYQPGKPVEELERELGVTDAIKISSNENPLGPSPRAIEAAIRALHAGNTYPDPNAFRLRRALSERLGVAPDELVFGAGSNELIHLVVQTFCRAEHDEVLAHKHAFISYRIASMACNVRFVESEVTSDLACDADALIAAMTPRTKVVFLANPNNPTGAYVRTADFERILAALPERALLVVDEAYYEYGVAARDAGLADYPQSLGYRGADMPRILTLRTFSKVYGLAGLRVGFGVGDRRVIELINRVRRPFNVSAPAQAAAEAALEDAEYVQRSHQVVCASIAAMSEGFQRLGLKPYPSLGNFVLVGVGRDAEPVYEALLRRGVITRPMRVWGLPRHLRVSAGTVEQTERVNAAMAEVVAELGA